MTESSNGVVILITLLNILVYKLQKLKEAQRGNGLQLSARQSCRRFSLRDIQWATNNFHEELVIGKGGFGNVYKGIIDFGESQVAIKRLGTRSRQGIKEFHTEIEMLSKFRHGHLVSLIGYCDDCEEMILVYDYMPRGTLADHLHKRVKHGDLSLPCLSWVQRLKICIGAAHGLDYLHTGTSTESRVIHRDVKTTNILLDDNFAAKISDFGLSKTGPTNQTHTYVSTRVKGTFGYLDPFYVSTHRLTRKSDVYSFGVVLFEVLCGRPAVDKSLDEEQINLAGWAQHCFKERLLDQITDPKIRQDISSDSLNAYVDVAIRCLCNQPKLRPSMAEVVVGLETALTLQEKSDHYTLVEISPTDFSQQYEDGSTFKVKNTNHNRQYENTGDGSVKPINGWRGRNQLYARMNFTKRASGLLSITARAFSVNKDAKTSKYYNGAQEVTSNKSQAADPPNFLPLDPSVNPTPPSHEVLQPSSLKIFTFNDLSVATRKFHRDNILGEGGFGCVYKGWVDKNTFGAAEWGTGLAIAVKKLGRKAIQGHQEWSAEVKYLGRLSHPNLVKLIGYCSEEEHRLIVYEFMPHGSLDKHIYRGDPSCQPLSWNLRISAALDVAKALAYLHSPEANNYKAKLTDFGSARDGPENESTHVSTRVMGTYGYAAPEYMATGLLTKKSDVYTFGVVLLEILTGRRAHDTTLPTKEQNLVHWASPYLTSKHKILRVMDADMKGQCTTGAALKLSSLALKCLSQDPKLRPDTNEVVIALEKLQ
ncbi:G-type lectin S-receptor-like serine/threonine-protein kinase At5g24080 isoform X2 [Daucus carota subsp. sativus]|uniref:G-type lectin S-receptor-like serine/threonine-protein kinase At5g24080 isoform X2 n=1 Tax=Daucus carota subsp. sativus TaxID=79200 RepID=UPI0007F04853|nr:PREDICTED: G-type lectin S-receptor-like serine/threonine-protein kinase At5g24080 isoform X2 [Daucus carota subsp. sativus]